MIARCSREPDSAQGQCLVVNMPAIESAMGSYGCWSIGDFGVFLVSPLLCPPFLVVKEQGYTMGVDLGLVGRGTRMPG